MQVDDRTESVAMDAADSERILVSSSAAAEKQSAAMDFENDVSDKENNVKMINTSGDPD